MSHFSVILSEAKNLVGKARKAEILRFAQNDKYLKGDGTPQKLREPQKLPLFARGVIHEQQPQNFRLER